MEIHQRIGRHICIIRVGFCDDDIESESSIMTKPVTHHLGLISLPSILALPNPNFCKELDAKKLVLPRWPNFSFTLGCPPPIGR